MSVTRRSLEEVCVCVCVCVPAFYIHATNFECLNFAQYRLSDVNIVCNSVKNIFFFVFIIYIDISCLFFYSVHSKKSVELTFFLNCFDLQLRKS